MMTIIEGILLGCIGLCAIAFGIIVIFAIIAIVNEFRRMFRR